jgi:hypothetical protein
MYNNNVVSQPLSLQGHIRPSERRRTRIPIIRHCCRGRRGDRRSCVHHRSCIRSLVLEISRRVFFDWGYISSRVLCSHNGG